MLDGNVQSLYRAAMCVKFSTLILGSDFEVSSEKS